MSLMEDEYTGEIQPPEQQLFPGSFAAVLQVWIAPWLSVLCLVEAPGWLSQVSLF